jgi:hypothetical protein
MIVEREEIREWEREAAQMREDEQRAFMAARDHESIH